MRIEVGKAYVSSCGSVVDIVERSKYGSGAFYGGVRGEATVEGIGRVSTVRFGVWKRGGAFVENDTDPLRARMVPSHPLNLVAEWTDEHPAVSPTLAQDGQTPVAGTETAADVETASTGVGNEKDGTSVSPPSFDVFADLGLTPLRVQLLGEGAALTNGARDREYGPPALNMACSGELKAVFRKHMRRSISDAEMEALDMVLTKVGRLATGNPKRDTYVDAATYMAIAGEIALTEGK